MSLGYMFDIWIHRQNRNFFSLWQSLKLKRKQKQKFGIILLAGFCNIFYRQRENVI